MKRLWKSIKSYTIFLASLSLVYALVLSCETVPELDPNPNPGNNDQPDVPTSDIEGCQYPVLAWNDTTLFNDTTLITTGSFRVLNDQPAVYMAFGFSFSVAFKGSIKELGIRVPERDTYTVRIYNEDPLNNDILAEAAIVAGNGSWKYVSIDALPLDPGEKYMACVYVRSKPDGDENFFFHNSTFAYPFEFGDVTIENYASTSANTMEKPVPTGPNNTVFNGFVDFCFEAD